MVFIEADCGPSAFYTFSWGSGQQPCEVGAVRFAVLQVSVSPGSKVTWHSQAACHPGTAMSHSQSHLLPAR